MDLERSDEVDDCDDETVVIFTERKGMKTIWKDNTNLLDFVEFHLTEEIIIHDVNQTNWYAKHFKRKILKKLS